MEKIMSSWPFSDITPNDVARFAAKGDWKNLEKVARLAKEISQDKKLIEAQKYLLKAWDLVGQALPDIKSEEGDEAWKLVNEMRKTLADALNKFRNTLDIG